jgi:hypothetical protein
VKPLCAGSNILVLRDCCHFYPIYIVKYLPTTTREEIAFKVVF